MLRALGGNDEFCGVFVTAAKRASSASIRANKIRMIACASGG